MTANSPRILIGVLNREQRGSIPTITHAFMTGLGDRYAFAGFTSERAVRAAGGGSFRVANILASLRDLFRWIVLVLRHRPAIAHYPVTSYWNFEKSLVLLLLARLLGGSRTLGHLHGGFFVEFWEGMSGLRRAIGRRLLGSLSGLVVLSESWRDWAAAHTGMPSGRIHIVNNPIDPEFEEAALRLPPGGSPDVLYLGALARSKGVFDLLEAAGKLRGEGLDLSITCAGPERGAGVREALERRRSELGLGTVRLLQPVSGPDKVALIGRCGILVLPSYRENFPLTVLEAAAAGRAIVATPVGATPEFFRDRAAALLVRPGDVDGLAAALRELVSSADLRSRLGSAAREVFRGRLDRSHVLDELDAVYRNLLAEGHSP